MVEIKFDQEIYNKALDVLIKRNYEDTCVKALICPICGNQLFYRRAFYEPTKIGAIQLIEPARLVCSNEKDCNYTIET